MSRKRTIHELTNLLAIALRHKIGSIVNPDEIYAQKYAKDAEILMKEAGKIAIKENWNNYDKIKIKEELNRKLKQELEKREFLDNRKFEFINEEINRALKLLRLV